MYIREHPFRGKKFGTPTLSIPSSWGYLTRARMTIPSILEKVPMPEENNPNNNITYVRHVCDQPNTRHAHNANSYLLYCIFKTRASNLNETRICQLQMSHETTARNQNGKRKTQSLNKTCLPPVPFGKHVSTWNELMCP